MDSLKKRIIRELESSGLPLGRHEEDRADPRIDFRFMHHLKGPHTILIEASEDSHEESRSALERGSRDCLLCTGRNEDGSWEDRETRRTTWPKSKTLRQSGDQITDTVRATGKGRGGPGGSGQAWAGCETLRRRRQKTVSCTRDRFPYRKEKSDGAITARVLHDGTNGIAFNQSARPRKVPNGVRLETRGAREGEER